MQALTIDANSPYLPALRSLYERSFPANERRELKDLFTVFGSAHEMLAFVHEGRFAGFVSLLRPTFSIWPWRTICAAVGWVPKRFA